MVYPDKQSAPREFEGGLERELGGPTAVRVSRKASIMVSRTLTICRHVWPETHKLEEGDIPTIVNTSMQLVY